jgi:hypothetical protein
MPVHQFVVSAGLAYPPVLRAALAAADAMDLARRQLTRLDRQHARVLAADLLDLGVPDPEGLARSGSSTHRPLLDQLDHLRARRHRSGP